MTFYYLPIYLNKILVFPIKKGLGFCSSYLYHTITSEIAPLPAALQLIREIWAMGSVG